MPAAEEEKRGSGQQEQDQGQDQVQTPSEEKELPGVDFVQLSGVDQYSKYR